MQPLSYAHAVKKAIKDGLGVSEAVKNLIKVLKNRGALALLPKIALELERIESREGRARSTLSVANDADWSTALKESGANKEGVIKQIDETLIGGFKFEEDGKLTDTSYKRALLDLYRKITN